MGSVWVTAITAAAAVLTALGGSSLVSTLARRRPTRVEAVVNLNESTFEWAERIEQSRLAERAAYEADREQFRADILESRREAREARDENIAANRVARTMRIELDKALDELSTMRQDLARYAEVMTAIRDPGMTMERLRTIADRQDRR